jgi:hypothetical protein
MGGCHLYLAANFHCPSAGQRKTDTRYGRRGRICFVFRESLFLGKEANLPGRRREGKKIKQQQTVQQTVCGTKKAAKRGRGLGAK